MMYLADDDYLLCEKCLGGMGKKHTGGGQGAYFQCRSCGYTYSDEPTRIPEGVLLVTVGELGLREGGHVTIRNSRCERCLGATIIGSRKICVDCRKPWIPSIWDKLDVPEGVLFVTEGDEPHYE